MFHDFLIDCGVSGVVALVVSILLSIVAGYFIGSVNCGVILSKILYKNDVRSHGSGNAGSTNMLRNYGVKACVFTLIGDMGKTALALALGFLFFVYKGMFIAGIAAMIGHSFPVYFNFKGGKGVASFGLIVIMSSIIMGLDYVLLVFLPLLVIFIVLCLFTRFVSLSSIISALLYPIIFNRVDSYIIGKGYPADQSLEIFAVVMAIIIVIQHRENIKRLLSGEENKLSFKKKNSDESK